MQNDRENTLKFYMPRKLRMHGRQRKFINILTPEGNFK